MHKWGRTRWRRGRWKWSIPLSTNASRTSKDAAVLTEDQVNTGRTPWVLRKNIRIHIELSRTKERRDKEEGERRKRAGDQPAPGDEGAEAQGRDPRIHGHPLGWGTHLKQLESELTNLWQSQQSENHTDKPCCNLAYLGHGSKSTGVQEAGSWTHGDCRMIPGWGLLLTLGSQPDGMGWWKSVSWNAS